MFKSFSDDEEAKRLMRKYFKERAPEGVDKQLTLYMKRVIEDIIERED